jgi:hypothetical protein
MGPGVPGWVRRAGLAAPLVCAFLLLGAVSATAGPAAPYAVSATDGVAFGGTVLSQANSCSTDYGSAVITSTISIDWGDGTPATHGTSADPSATNPNGRVTIQGAHTYAQPGTYQGTVKYELYCLDSVPVNDQGTFTATVADAPPAAARITVGDIVGEPVSTPVATFTDNNVDAAASTYTATIDWGDGSPVGAGTITGTYAGFTVDGVHTYATVGSYPVKVTITDGNGVKTVDDETAVVSNAPTSVAFSVSPDTDPVLSRQTLTYSITDPTPGVTYEWDFGDTDTPTGSPSAPFVLDATGTSVTHAYPDPAPAPSNPNTADCQTITGCNGGFSVYVVRVTALIPGHANLSATPQNLVVVPVKPPTASFEVLRTSVENGGSAASTAVTHPVTIVPQASLPERNSGAQDQIVREDFYFDLAPGATPTGPPELTCLPNGTCGHYTGSALVPTASELTAAPGEANLGTKPLTTASMPCTVLTARDARARRAREPSARHGVRGDFTNPVCTIKTTVAPTGGFESFSLNFWNRALERIGSAGGVKTLPQEEAPYCAYPYTNCGGSEPLVDGYPPLADVNLNDVDGYQGGQGIVTGADGCFPGYPIDAPDEGCPSVPYNPAGPLYTTEGAVNNAVQFGPYDLATYGVGSAQQLEDQWNFLYNYATVVGTDTNLDGTFGPSTGASEGKGKRVLPRTITMIAYDAEGVPSAPYTKQVPLTPATHPTLNLCVKVVYPSASPCIAPGNSAPPFQITAGDGSSNPNSGTELNFDTTGSSGGTDPILYFAVAVGQPNQLLSQPSTICPVGKLGGFSVPSQTAGNPPSGPPTKPPKPPKHPTAADITVGPGGGLSGVKIIVPSTPTTLTPFPMPVFSDLEAGAFPYHDCGSYAIRTVNANAKPEALPPSGPNVIVKTAVARAAAARAAAKRHSPTAHASSDPSVATGGLYGLSGTAGDSPDIITTNPNGLNVRFAQQGIYSVSVAAYNTSGLAAITRIDGFEALAPSAPGECKAVNSQPITLDDGKESNSTATLGFSGQCVTVVTAGTSGSKELYVSSSPIDIDGVPLVPQPGDEIVVDFEHNPNLVYVTDGSCQIPTGDLTNPSAALAVAHCGPPSTSQSAPAGNVYVTLSGGQNSSSSPPGIAEMPQFNIAAADWYLGPSVSSLAPVGTPPTGTTSPTGCGLYPGAQAWHLPSGAQYENFNVTTEPCLTFTSNQQSRIAFWDALPGGFNNGSSQPATAQVVLQGSDTPASVALSTNQYANVARGHVRKPHRVIAGSAASFPKPVVRAHQADLGLPGFPSVPSCPPSVTNTSGLDIPQGTDLGPIQLPAGAQFCYIASTGDFVGNIDVNIPGPLPLNDVDVGFEIGHGRLIDAGGEISGNVPIGPLIVNNLKFDIQTDPVEVAGAIEASILDVVDIEAGVIVNSSPPNPSADFEGSVGLFGFQFGNFSLDFTKNTVGMSVSISKDFGPASLNITVKGAMIFSPSFQFYAEGTGSACLFICLGVQGLISNEGVAACGSINLLFVTLSAGVAVIWSGPESGVHLFTGCDLTPYIPAALRNVATSRDGPDGAAVAAAQAPLPPGGSTQLVLYRKGDCTPTRQKHCVKTTVAIQVHSLLSSEAVGETPIVTLAGPGGTADSRVIETPPTPGYYGFDSEAGLSGGTTGGQTDEGTSLVAQDPVPTSDPNKLSEAFCKTPKKPASCPRVTTTTLFVADPGKGKWTLSVAADSPPVVDIAKAYSAPPVKPSSFNGAVHIATLQTTSTGFEIKTDGLTFPSSKLNNPNIFRIAPSIELPDTSVKIFTALKHPSSEDIDVPPLDESRLRAVLLKVPAGFAGTVSVIDHGPTVDQVLAGDISAKHIPKHGLPILFEPTPDFGAKHEIEAFLTNTDGTPGRVLVLSRFGSPKLSKPDAPKILKVVRKGANVKVFFNPMNDPIANGVGLSLATTGGQTFEDTFAASALHAVGKLSGIAGARQAKEYVVTIHDVDPTEDINVEMDGINDGVLGGAASRSMGPGIKSSSESHLFSLVHVKL